MRGGGGGVGGGIRTVVNFGKMNFSTFTGLEKRVHSIVKDMHT